MPAPKFVLIRGLVKKPELNGKYGSVVGGIDDGRYPVQVRDPQSNDLKTFKVKSENTTAVTLAELCKGLPHPIEIYKEKVAASSLQTFKPRLAAIRDRLESLPQDEGQFRDVKDLALCVELGLAKFASLSSAGFPAARVEELRDYFCRRVAEVAPETSYLNDLALVGGKRWPFECCYHLCYTSATDCLIQYHHLKKGAFEEVNKLCEQWLAYEEHRRAAGAGGAGGFLSIEIQRSFVDMQANVLNALGKSEDAMTMWEEMLRMLKQKEVAAEMLMAGRPAEEMDMVMKGIAKNRAGAALSLACARLSANKITRAEHKKTLEELKKRCPRNTNTYRDILRILRNSHGQKLTPAESGQACRDTHCAICLESLAEGVAEVVLQCGHGFHFACHKNYIDKLIGDARKATAEGRVPQSRAFCPTCRDEGWRSNHGQAFQKELDICRDVALGRMPIPTSVSW